ncbi:MAG: lipid A deacylase LpxR family protein, partial [Sphingobacteriaceae bacterium]
FLKDEQVFEAALNAGTIGPNAYGKDVQEGLHDIIGFYEVRGWEYQVNNEIGINASFNYSRLLARKNSNSDFSLNTYANLGNTFTGAGAGVLFRAGRINKFYNSVSNNSRISNSEKNSIPDKEIYFFTRPMLNFVAYDATIQGGMFTDNKGPVTYNPNHFQYSQEFGVNYAVNRWTLNFSVILKSRDVKTQNKPHQYGSASIYYRFN